MHLVRKFVFAASMALILVPGRAAFAADDLQSVLHKLDQAAAGFRSASADFEFDSVTTEPVADKTIQKGTIYYERKGKSFKMGIHFREENGKPVPKVVAVSGGTVKLYEKLIDQVTTFSKAGKFESYAMLGFGASGKDLTEMWNITDQGSEALNGVKTEKLELIAKDPQVVKQFPKVTIWVDPERGVTLKQVLDEGPGQYRIAVYFNIKVNQRLPGDAFSFKTDRETRYVTQ
ncbi:MAG: outer membrane lipoprotein carrier protein LolA [Acidobacteriota bacterium]|nr:outer membrane lipoprotein carrier protein LolA [Acidobacteriota bacterium]